MKKYFLILLSVLTILSLTACETPETPPITTAVTTTATTTVVTTVPTTAVTTAVPTTAPTTEPTTAPTLPPHSPLYIPDVSVEDVIRFFNEVCLDAEYFSTGNPELLQKWSDPIRYTLDGDCTDEDIATLTGFTDWLNTVEGFPGISQVQDTSEANLHIHFCTYDELTDILGNQFIGADGGVTFWYDGFNSIYDATICISTEIDQTVRNSVILEEVYNSLGPVQDTQLREDSIIYSGYSEPQCLTQMDMLILNLLYHPEIKCGMTAEECEAVIRQLYY